MYYQEEIECMPRAELEALQVERLRWAVKHAYENVPLYKQRFDEAGLDPYSIESLEDIKRFPFIVKQDMRDAYPFGLFAVDRSEVKRLHASSGTTGQATVVGYTENDLKNWGDCFARGIAMVGGSAESTMQVSYGYGLFTGGLGAHMGGEAAGCTVVPMSTGNTKRQIQIMKDFGTDILCATPSYALLIADTAIEMGYDPAKDFPISGVILGAEPASEHMREEIRQKFGVKYCDVYGLSEIMGPGVAMECSESHGLHVAEDQFLVEIVDPETLEPVPDGQLGELVITTLTRECSPLIRYRTRDLTRIIDEPCACGRTHRKIDRIVGRTDDMLIIRGVNVFPSQIEQVITGFPEIVPHYQIVLTTKGTLDHVELRVETAPDFSFDEIRALEDLRRRLAAELKSNLQIAVDIKIVEPKTIERSEGKAKRVIDLRNKD
ncbi:phenylacetate--CoA ligase family protein [Slackia piriformis]